MIMEYRDNYQGKNVLVVGMARSGISSAKLLLKLGATVALYDRKTREELNNDKVNYLIDEKGVKDLLGVSAEEAETWADEMVLSPGVPIRQPLIEEAKAHGKRVIAEIGLGYEVAKCPIIGIGGTNGKTTTTSLTGEIFKNAGKNTFVLGNIGLPLTEHAYEAKETDYIVAEIAALQLETTEHFRPKAFALLNITVDHLDRFGTMDYYTECKMKAFQNQTRDDIAILNIDDPITLSQIHKIKSKLMMFSRRHEVDEGAFVRDGMIVFRMNGRESEVCRTDEVRIPGNHNLENALAAVCLSMCMGISANVVAYTLKTFAGVEHRIEFVREVNGIRFINDSKGTNPDSTIKAIETMTGPTVLILGGYDKHISFDDMFDHFTDNIKDIVILGAVKDQLVDTAERKGFRNYHVVDTFEEAVKKAYSLSAAEGTVLLSPACASWDMFDNFEQRGEIFKNIVKAL